MDKKWDKKLKELGIFKSADAEREGISRVTLSRLLAAGSLSRLDTGIYAHRETKLKAETLDFAIACLRCGEHSIIGGITALSYYGLTEEVPDRIWILVPPEIRSPSLKYRVIRTKQSLEIGILEKDGYRIVSVERAILDGLWYRSKIGEAMALAAARRAIKTKRVTRQKLFNTAQELDQIKILEKYWELINTP